MIPSVELTLFTQPVCPTGHDIGSNLCRGRCELRNFGELLSQPLLVLCNLPFNFRFLFLSAQQVLPVPL